jgi:5-formyltetrahydrofolate cyclo-ligase
MGFSYQHNNNDAEAEKDAIRTRVLSARREMDGSQRAEADSAILTTLDKVTAHGGKSPLTVAAYHPMRDEPGADLPQRLAGAGHRVLLPVLLDDNDLDWAWFTGRTITTARRLPEPSGARLGPGALDSADLVVVPALAVGGTGIRLGRGGGSYDRALSRVKAGVPVVALLYDGEWPMSVPVMPHDRPVTMVITPTGGLAEVMGLATKPPRMWPNQRAWRTIGTRNIRVPIRGGEPCPRTSTPAPAAVTTWRRSSPSPTSR